MTVSTHRTPSDAVTFIDWSAPWLEEFSVVGHEVVAHIGSGVAQPQAFNAVAHANAPSALTAPITFVSHAQLPPGEAYEQFIFDHALCPTRDGLHDFFNGLAWLHFPQIKRRLNQLHVAQIARTGIAPVRGPTRDALTLFDENAALMRAPDALWDALMAKQWSLVFGGLRHLWSQSYVLLFGHALLEKLVQPRKSITAHVYRAYPSTDSIASMDQWMAAELSADKLASKPFAHLPVLGVPGWCSANEVPNFYDDVTVFRHPRVPEFIAQ